MNNTPSISNRTLILAIRAYQRYVSPYKGYRCAHHQLHGRGSCSSHGIHCLQTMPLMQARSAMKVRFSECGSAAAERRATGSHPRSRAGVCHLLSLLLYGLGCSD